MTRARLLLAVIAVLAVAAPARGHAGEPMSDADLAEQRGGLMTPLGFEIGFGASVRTFVDGRLALETQLSWTDAGRQMTEFRGAGPPDVQVGAWSGALPALSAPGAAILHDLSQDRIAGVVLNTLNDRLVRQEIDIRLHLPQLPDLQRQIAAQQVAAMADAAVWAGGPR